MTDQRDPREHRTDLFTGKEDPVLVDVTLLPYLTIDGKGAPGLADCATAVPAGHR